MKAASGTGLISFSSDPTSQELALSLRDIQFATIINIVEAGIHIVKAGAMSLNRLWERVY